MSATGRHRHDGHRGRGAILVSGALVLCAGAVTAGALLARGHLDGDGGGADISSRALVGGVPARHTGAPDTTPPRPATPSATPPAAPTGASVQPAADVVPLRVGSRGSAVSEVQRTLAALGYQVRAATGVYDDETMHAVTAFEKVNGLHRDGVVDAAVRRALAHPAAPRPRHHRAGLAMEVDLTRQVAYVVRDGRITRVYDVCTGGPDSPTPPGEFTVKYKIDGLRHAALGPMWRPVYFTYTGIAFHGSEPVRTTPASHGCVRMTDPAQNELFPMLTPGVPVSVY